MVRTANAFNVGGVHILGRRRWNRRGAMVTDRYLTVHHHADGRRLRRLAPRLRTTSPSAWTTCAGAVPLETAPNCPSGSAWSSGRRAPDSPPNWSRSATGLVAITQYGSTRSINAGAAAAIAMYHWARSWAR